jgi:uncharacterized protein (DUF1499 family)
MRRIVIRSLLLLLCAPALAGCGLGSATLRQPDGRLSLCQDGPHCVSSQETNADRRVEPLVYSGAREAARLKLLAVLAAEPSFRLITSTPDYIHVEASTAIMRYVDDLEFVFDPAAPRIDVRSSSRIGYYDFDTNRARIEKIRAAFAAP